MSPRTVVFRLIGLVGCVGGAFSMHDMVTMTACVDAGRSCETAPGLFVGRILGSTLLVIIGISGGGYPIFAGLFAGLGAGALVGAWETPSTDSLRWAAFILAFLFLPGGLLILLGGSAREASRRRRAELLRTGVRAVATVLEVRDTGTSRNDDPSVQLTLDVAATGQSPPFRASVTQVVSRVCIPRPGDRLEVAFDPLHPDDLVLDTERLQSPAAGPPPAVARPAPVDELERLAGLHARGDLTDAEYATLKARLLAG